MEKTYRTYYKTANGTIYRAKPVGIPSRAITVSKPDSIAHYDSIAIDTATVTDTDTDTQTVAQTDTDTATNTDKLTYIDSLAISVSKAYADYIMATASKDSDSGIYGNILSQKITILSEILTSARLKRITATANTVNSWKIANKVRMQVCYSKHTIEKLHIIDRYSNELKKYEADGKEMYTKICKMRNAEIADTIEYKTLTDAYKDLKNKKISIRFALQGALNSLYTATATEAIDIIDMLTVYVYDALTRAYNNNTLTDRILLNEFDIVDKRSIRTASGKTVPPDKWKYSKTSHIKEMGKIVSKYFTDEAQQIQRNKLYSALEKTVYFTPDGTTDSTIQSLTYIEYSIQPSEVSTDGQSVDISMLEAVKHLCDTARLTDTEVQVLKWYFLDNATADEVCHKINISARTLYKYVDTIRKKIIDSGLYSNMVKHTDKDITKSKNILVTKYDSKENILLNKSIDTVIVCGTREAERLTEVDNSIVTKICKGIRKHSYANGYYYTFKYID